jgi:glutamate synthase domain-containing protein 1
MTSPTDCYGFPEEVGLYCPDREKDACGVGFIVNIDGHSSNKVSIVVDILSAMA